MDLRKVKKLIELLEESGIAEIEIKEGEESVRISRLVQSAAIVAPMAAAPVPAAGPAAVAAAAPPPARPDGHVVTSPMVGTFYSAPSPEAAAFVKVARWSRWEIRSASSRP